MRTAPPAARGTILAVLVACVSILGAHGPAFPRSTLPPREQWLASFDRMPEPALASLFLRCDREARVRVLDFADGVRCAMAWDALLKRVFDGDVNALIAWWRAHRGEHASD